MGMVDGFAELSKGIVPQLFCLLWRVCHLCEEVG